MSLNAIVDAFAITLKFEYFLFQVVFLNKKYNEIKLFELDRWARVQLYSLGLIFKLWGLPHYRAKSLQQDMIDNLRNVAVPGTGIPLSIFCYSWFVCLWFICFVNPIICLFGAINKVLIDPNFSSRSVEYLVSNVVKHYVNHLLHPDDWFSLWRLNCQVVSYHSQVTKSADYKQEDKWTFLRDGRALGVPVSPYLDMPSIVCKNKNIEGGMGIHFYKNAIHGGDWIIQERLENAAWLNALLPANAPLSTLRIITASTWSLGFSWNEVLSKQTLGSNRAPNASSSKDGASSVPTDSASLHSHNRRGLESESSTGKPPVDEELSEARRYIKALSGVLRLGRKGASTDHSSVLFDVDIVDNSMSEGEARSCSGRLGRGTTNRHWYVLGLNAGLHCPWLPPDPVPNHPDEPYPVVAGKCIPDINEAVEIVTRAHMKMMKDVPLVGWDVAFTSTGICLLEVNLSCNFFRGSFDMPSYISFVEQYWKQLDNDVLSKKR